MRNAILGTVFIAIMLLFMGTCFAIDDDKDGCMKISLDPSSLFGSSEKEGEARAERVDDATDDEKYTYNAMGQKVPTRTDRSGAALSGH